MSACAHWHHATPPAILAAAAAEPPVYNGWLSALLIDLLISTKGPDKNSACFLDVFNEFDFSMLPICTSH